MFNKNLFKSKYIEHNLKAADVAVLLGINPATLTRKMSGESDFTRNEIQLFRMALNLSAEEIENIFFA